MVLKRVEMSRIAQENFRMSAKSTFRIIFSVYVGLTALETIALIFCKMNRFNAIVHSFATIATGGFSSKNASIAYYNSLSIELVIIGFILCFWVESVICSTLPYARQTSLLYASIWLLAIV